jgi:hypothetical protein
MGNLDESSLNYLALLVLHNGKVRNLHINLKFTYKFRARVTLDYVIIAKVFFKKTK